MTFQQEAYKHCPGIKTDALMQDRSRRREKPKRTNTS